MSLYGNRDKVQDSAISKVKEDVATLDSSTIKSDGTGAALPTSDPSVAGVLWSNSGIVTVSSG